MPNTENLICTKMHLPFTRPELVRRSRLQEHLAVGIRAPLTLVIAPAGFGKTTLVASALSGCCASLAWLSLDAEDNREGRFLTYLVAALQTVDGRIGGAAVQLLSNIQQASTEAVLTSLVNDLDSFTGEMILALDDYHVIHNPAVYQAVAFLLEHRPPGFHLVLISRSDPPLPLARLRARGQVVELRAADLRFTREEAASFLKDVMGLQLDADAVTILEERTEGWIAGLQMAALSMRERRDIPAFLAAFSGTNRYILDYLLEEVLAGQPQAVQHFLLYTSVLERLNAPLCDALLSLGDLPVVQTPQENGLMVEEGSTAFLKYLECKNLFLLSLDDEHIWFRYHHLLIDLLRARLQGVYPDLVPRLHVQAATWLEQNGFIVDAIRHLFTAGEEEWAIRLIERYGPLRWAENDLSVMRLTVELSPELLCSNPRIGIYTAWMLINRGEIEKVFPLLKGILHRFSENNLPPGQEWIDMVSRLALAFLNKPSDSERMQLFPSEEALQQVPDSDPVLQDASQILYTMTLARRGENERAAEVAVRCLQQPRPAVPALAISSLVSFLASINWYLGRLNEVISVCRRNLLSIERKGLLVSASGNLCIVLGEALYELNNLDDAAAYIRQGLKANEPWDNIMTAAFGLIALARVQYAQGDYTGAIHTVERFERRLQGEMRPVEFREDFHTLKVRLQLAAGHLPAVEQWVQQVPYHEDFCYCPDWFRPMLARICLAQGRFLDAMKILNEIDCVNLAGNQMVRNIEMHLLRALALAGMQCLPEALDALETALALGEPEGYMRVFLDEGEALRVLLCVYQRSPETGHQSYVARLLAAFPPEDASAQTIRFQHDELVEPLTQRELEVLRLMSLGRTNQEIAEQLVVARGTIKAHAASIYRKLGADNRTEAVAHARNMGILS